MPLISNSEQFVMFQKIPKYQYTEFLEALKTNTNIVKINLANTGMDDILAYVSFCAADCMYIV